MNQHERKQYLLNKHEQEMRSSGFALANLYEAMALLDKDAANKAIAGIIEYLGEKIPSLNVSTNS